jgi:hypothetical protein
MEAGFVSATPDRFYKIAASMKAGGASLDSILRDLLDQGASDLDVVRVVKKVEDVSLPQARELISRTGLSGSGSRKLTAIIPDDDPWSIMRNPGYCQQPDHGPKCTESW